MSHAYAEPLKIGHRGCRGILPENTIAGFKAALDAGLDGIELDVHLSQDGEVFVHHDFTPNIALTRTPDGSWIREDMPALCTLASAQIHKLRLGHIKPDSDYSHNYPKIQDSSDEPIPTLQKVFDLMKNYPDRKIFVEVKTQPLQDGPSSDPLRLTHAVMELVRQHNNFEQVSLLAFDWHAFKSDHPLIQKVQRVFNFTLFQHPEAPGSFRPEWLAGRVEEYGNSIPKMVAAMGGHVLSVYYKEITQDLIDEVHKLGLKIGAWTVNDKAIADDLAKKGVDIIFTDYPAILTS